MASLRSGKILVIIICLAFCKLPTRISCADSPAYQRQLGPFSGQERLLILAPHPDDEAIACAGIIQEALNSGAKVKIAYLTNGEHNQFAFIVYKKRIVFKKNEFIILGQLRRQEAVKAMRLLGVNEEDLIFLGYPDFGTFSIFSKYWNTDTPFRSFLTRISSVPYEESPSFGAPYFAENIVKDIKKILLDYCPDKIFVSHPADVNVDHKSYYLFLQVALAELKGIIPAPKVYPYLVHHVGWPMPRHYHPELFLEPPVNIPSSQIAWQSFNLTPQQLEKKREAILCYKTQTESSAFYLLSFARKNELFGDYPPVDLVRQDLPGKKPLSFFGSSGMFPELGSERYYPQDNILKTKERVSFALLDKYFVVRIEKPAGMLYRFSTVSYIYGYNYKVPFSAMPKVRIVTRHDNLKVFDGRRLIDPENISVELTPKLLVIKIPLSALGLPDFILASVRCYIGKDEGGNSPVYVTGFRRINIK